MIYAYIDIFVEIYIDFNIRGFFFFFKNNFGGKNQIILTISFIKAIKGGKYPNRGDLLFMGSVFLQPLSPCSKSFVEILQQKL